MDREGPLTEDTSLERLRDEVLDRDTTGQPPEQTDQDKDRDDTAEAESGVLGQLNDEDGMICHPALN